MNAKQSPGTSFDAELKCETCGCTGEARRSRPVSDPPLSEWLQPPNGWWVRLNESNLRVRCPTCLELSEHVSNVP